MRMPDNTASHQIISSDIEKKGEDDNIIIGRPLLPGV
jgi:hypothetical protein